MRTHQRKRYRKIRHLLGTTIIFAIVFSVLMYYRYSTANKSTDDPEKLTCPDTTDSLGELSGVPDELVALLEKNPETRDFVLNYRQNKDLIPEIDLSEYMNSESIPLLLQWDERWGYNQYAGELMGLSGCGPTCLSMVCIYLLRDPIFTPKYIAEFAESNGYSVLGNGSAWTLISSGGKELGLDVTEIPLDQNRIIRNLEVGNPIICVMGPGDFTSTGHYIVLTGYADGMVSVNDPNSNARSKQLWDLTSIMGQIRNLWVCRA